MDASGKYATTDCPAGLETTLVADLMDANGAWDIHRIGSMFNARDSALVQKIPLTSTPRLDIHIWAYTKDGNFSIRTAYMIGMSLPLQPRNEL